MENKQTTPPVFQGCLFDETLILHQNKNPTSESPERTRHRNYMRSYRQRSYYPYIDRVYNVTEYYIRCLRGYRSASSGMLTLVGASSWEDFQHRFEYAMGGSIDLASYGITWFVAHKKAIHCFNLSDAKQFHKCVSLENLKRGVIAKPWRKPAAKTEDNSPFLPGFVSV